MTEVVEEKAAVPAVRGEALMTRSEITVGELVEQSAMIEAAMQEAMKPGLHYGQIRGIKKPTLLKPGAEKLLVLFRLAPEYESEKIWHDDGHLTVVTVCTLRHIHSGTEVGQGEGLCSSRESKYAYRSGERTCPDCGQSAIVRSTKRKAYFCIKDKGGCGTRFAFGTEKAKALDKLDAGKVANPDIADTYNTVLKMADKRALVAAVLNATAASDLFTQDVEDTERGATAGERAAAVHAAADEAASAPADPRKAFLHPSPPKTQNEIGERLKGIDSAMPWGEWLDQVAEVAFKESNGWRELGDEIEPFMYLVANAIGELESMGFGGGAVPGPTRSEVQSAFAAVLGGEVLPGPAAPLDDAERAEIAGAGSDAEQADAALDAEASAAMAREADPDIGFGDES